VIDLCWPDSVHSRWPCVFEELRLFAPWQSIPYLLKNSKSVCNKDGLTCKRSWSLALR